VLAVDEKLLDAWISFFKSLPSDPSLLLAFLIPICLNVMPSAFISLFEASFWRMCCYPACSASFCNLTMLSPSQPPSHHPHLLLPATLANEDSLSEVCYTNVLSSFSFLFFLCFVCPLFHLTQVAFLKTAVLWSGGPSPQPPAAIILPSQTYSGPPRAAHSPLPSHSPFHHIHPHPAPAQQGM